MIFITGPMFSGKKDAACDILGCTRQELSAHAVWDVQTLAAESENLESLAQSLAENEIVIASEIGAGIVPEKAGERAAREAAGRLACLLSARADTVVRVFCGIPTVIKGELK